MATHSSTLAWEIPWKEEPGRLQSMGSQRVGHDWATSLSLFAFMHWRRKWQPLQCSCLENPRDGGAWWADVYGVAQSQTWLKRFSSSSSLVISCVWLCYPMSVANKTPLSMEIFQARILESICYFLLYGIFLIQGLNPYLLRILHWQADSLPLSHLGSQYIVTKFKYNLS